LTLDFYRTFNQYSYGLSRHLVKINRVWVTRIQSLCSVFLCKPWSLLSAKWPHKIFPHLRSPKQRRRSLMLGISFSKSALRSQCNIRRTLYLRKRGDS
jgi:hypothetical protein